MEKEDNKSWQKNPATFKILPSVKSSSRRVKIALKSNLLHLVLFPKTITIQMGRRSKQQKIAQIKNWPQNFAPTHTQQIPHEIKKSQYCILTFSFCDNCTRNDLPPHYNQLSCNCQIYAQNKNIELKVAAKPHWVFPSCLLQVPIWLLVLICWSSF